MGDLLIGAMGGEGWWGILLFIPLLLAGHVSEGAVAYGLWRRSVTGVPAQHAWVVAGVSGAIAAAFLVAAMVWVGTYLAPRLAAELAAWL
jgi:hypothetical protein